MKEFDLNIEKIEAKVSKDIIDNISSDISLKYENNFRQIEQDGRSKYIWITFFISVMSLVIAYSPAGLFLKNNIINYIEFNLRSSLSKDVQISDRLKLIVKDDNFISFMKKPDLSIIEWAEVLKYLSSHKPKAIFIDKIFSIGRSSNYSQNELEIFADAIETIENIAFPIYTGASTNSGPIQSRSPLNTAAKMYDLNKYTRESLDKESLDIAQVGKNLPYQNPEFVFAKHPDYKNAFAPASIQYIGERYIHPMLRMGDDKVIPHLGILTADEIELNQKGLIINRKDTTMKNGKTIVNYLRPEKVYSQARSLKSLFSRISQQKETGATILYDTFIKPGDYIFIVPEFFTGATDFKNSPFGRVFGGLVVASLMNSTLTGEWIAELDSPFYLLAFYMLTGVVVSSVIPLYGWFFLIGANAAVFYLGVYSFSYHNLAIPWFFAVLGSFLLGVLVMVVKSKQEKSKLKVIEDMKIETEMIAKENILFEENQKVLLQEKREASVIASAFRPDRIPDWQGLKISAFHKCFDAASGDWFFFENSSDGKLCHIIMCDITGHGVQAAIIVSTCKSVLNTMRNHDDQIVDRCDFTLKYLRILNKILYMQGKGKHITTYAGITIDLENDKLHYITCSHPSPIVHKLGAPLDSPVFLRMRNDPVGFMPDLDLETKIIDFCYGDSLVLYTDGIPISENFRHYKSFLKNNSFNWWAQPEKMYHFIWEKIKAKSGKDPDDDVSLMIVKHEFKA